MVKNCRYQYFLNFYYLNNMARIQQLPPHEAQKIAAGEVVDRPANVIKELVENALDAHATQISVWVEDGGKELIRIRDNGHGMSAQDARMCTLNHATSKITSINDLETIETFGFRGEALASITAVAHTKLITQEPEQLSGIALTLECGEIITEEIAAGPTGTDIIIRDLFYNIPARKKFLKARDTEWRAIQQYFYAVCLSYETVDFQLYHEQKLILNCSATTSKQERLAQIFEKSMSQQMLACTTTENTSFSITGFISGTHYARYDRNQIFFFVNKRWIKNHKLSQALMRGYHNCLQPGRYPAAAIFITIDPHLVDINIHPRKEEVQFLHPRIVEVAIETLVKKRLEEYTSDQFKQPTHFVTTQPKLSQDQSISFVTSRNYSQSIQPAPFAKSTYAQHAPAFDAPISYVFPELAQQQIAIAQDTISTQAKLEQATYTILGNLHATYIQLETQEGLVMVDQHAAHERVLYEEFVKRFQGDTTAALIVPEIVTLSENNCATLLTQEKLFQQHGILFEQVGPQQLAVTSIPLFLKNCDYKELFQQVLSWIDEQEVVAPADFFKVISEKLRAQMACKTAIKAGDILTPEATRKLIADLYATERRFSCPHGRPTSWLISRSEIERKFKRKV
jgi:DNA mismatch repair protein MutL